jgi:hypothetical protein
VTIRVDEYVLQLEVPVNNTVVVEMMDIDKLIADQDTDLKITVLGRILTSSAVYARMANRKTLRPIITSKRSPPG